MKYEKKPILLQYFIINSTIVKDKAFIHEIKVKIYLIDWIYLGILNWGFLKIYSIQELNFKIYKASLRFIDFKVFQKMQNFKINKTAWTENGIYFY